ncbi:MAG: hypothetical protein WCP18_01950 [bacterium]
MNAHLEIVNKILSADKTDSIPPQKMAGSSDSSVYLANGKIYRLGNVVAITADQKLYAEFSQAGCLDIFPNILRTIRYDSTMVIEMEYVGKKTIEEMLLSFDGQEKEFERLNLINLKILALINKFFLITVDSKNSQSDKVEAYQELLVALRLNLEKAAMFDDVALELLDRLEKNSDVFMADMKLSKIHKDLSVGNIVIGPDDEPRLIDPRTAIPNLQVGSVWGNPAFDLVGYQISLLRKEAELKKKNPAISFKRLIKNTDLAIQQGISAKRFNQSIVELCQAVWYSIYCACSCDYCLSKERVWLYQDMKKGLAMKLETLSELLRL